VIGMPTEVDLRHSIARVLADFASTSLADAATGLFSALGYRSDKRLAVTPNTAESFLATFDQHRSLKPEQALLNNWRSVDFLFQLTDDEIRASATGDQPLPFDSGGRWNNSIIESYLFFAIELAPRRYTRTELSGITRAVNRLFSMPAMLLFKHGETLTLAVITPAQAG
jgi:adenine-specific DNA-methyltransferase